MTAERALLGARRHGRGGGGAMPDRQRAARQSAPDRPSNTRPQPTDSILLSIHSS